MSAVSMMSVQEFEASVYVSEQVNRQLINMSQDLAHRCIAACAERYNFDAEEATRLLGLAMIKVERKAPMKEKVSAPKAVMPKAAFPLPYNGEFNDACCYALRQNNGLYTQCTGVRKGDAQFCKGCATLMQKTGAELPEYGTIQQRMAVGIFEYVDPKGRKPVAYTKVMKKYKISQEQVLEEAGKLNIIINDEHFVEPMEDSKRGRPKTEKEPKVKGAKGRPKKEKKVLMIEGDEEDLFAALLSEANELLSEDEEVAPKPKKGKTEEEKEAERLAKEAEKAEKEAKRLAEKAEKESKLAAEKAEKEAKKEEERLAREAKKKAEEEEKALKKQAAEQAKKEKEAKLAAEKLAKEAEKAAKKEKALAAKPAESKPESKPEEPEEEPDVVKVIKFEGEKYLKSKKTGIVYDYKQYVENEEQVVVGVWNEEEERIIFNAKKEEDEEEEEEYSM